MKYKDNHTTNMKVSAQREAENKDSIRVEFEVPPPKAKKGKDGESVPMPYGVTSRATICMSKEEAAHYPVGSTAAIHCVPGKDTEAEEDYPDNLQGRRAKEEDGIIARTKGYREEA